jgi:signal-transduction protein with cAMP-binding, CBS, and nucleotidyltransferase domain
MSAPVVTVGPETPAKTAEGLLARHGFTALPVLDADQQLIGMVSESDFVADRFPRESRPASRYVADVMSAPSTLADIDTDVAYLARMMLDKRIRSVPVLDRGKLIGIVTTRDFLRVLARPDQVLVRDVQVRLAAFSAPDRWIVEVHDGEATIVDRFDSEQDRQVATVLAEGVPGIIRARCVVMGAESQRNA